MSEFLGASRGKLVHGLVDLFQDIANRRESHWVSLEAPSGWGKTRVGRELYARLAASQESPRYWPAVIDDPRFGRKATNPVRVDREAGSLPEFLWWGIGCSTRFGVPEDALRRDLAQLEAHSLFAEAAWRALVSVRGRVDLTLAEARRRLAEDGVLDLISVGVEQLLGVTLPPLGMATRLARWTAKEVSDTIGERRAIASHGGIELVESLELVDDTADLLSRLGRSGLPVVILIEDLHKADTTLLALLDILLRRDGALLLVSTTLPDTMDADPALKRLVTRHGGRLHRVTETGTDPRGQPFASDAGLSELERAERARLLHAAYPRVEKATREALLDTYVNPWALELFGQIPKYQHSGEYRTTSGELWLPLDERSQLPQRIEDLYKSIWDELPSQIRFVLATAYIITPSRIDSTEGVGEDRWADSVLREVIGRLDHPITVEILRALDQAPTAYAWIRLIDIDLRAFAESPQEEIAGEYGYGLLDEELHNARSGILRTLAHSLLESSKTTALTVNASRSILALFAQDYFSDHDAVARAIGALLISLEGYPRALPERIRLFDRFCQLDVSQIEDDLALPIRRRGAIALLNAGQLERAIELFEELEADLLRVHGLDHPGISATRNDLASALGDAGRLDEAIGLFEELVADRRQVQGPNHPETLTARNNLAGALGRAGRLDKAIDSFKELAADLLRVLGPDHPDTLTARNNLAGYLGDAGRLDEAIATFEDLAADRQRVLGPDHPATLTTRHNLASKLSRAGRLDEAIATFEELAADRQRVLGPDHPATLATRINLAVCLGDKGCLDEAIASLEELVADLARVLGSGHPTTLTARNNLAGYLGTAGRLDEAIASLKKLEADLVRDLGPDHPDTLTARNNLAGYIGRAGRLEKAIDLFEELVAERQRVLGPDHPATLTTRNNLAGCLGEAGRLGEAVARFDELVADGQRVLGPDHPDTLTSRHNLARYLGMAGRRQKAIGLFEELLTDLLRVFGPDHPDTLTTRIALADCQGEAGHPEQAIASLKELLAHLLRVLGPDHPDTLTARHSLATNLARAGRLKEAIISLKDLVTDRQRVLGPDDPDTLATRSNLAGNLAEVGSREEAIALFERLYADVMRVLGPDHPGTLATRDAFAGYLAEAGRHEDAVALLAGNWPT